MHSERKRMTASPEYTQHKLESRVETKYGNWGVEVTVIWQEDKVEKRMKSGHCQGFMSPVEAQSWGIILWHKMDRRREVSAISIHISPSSI